MPVIRTDLDTIYTKRIEDVELWRKNLHLFSSTEVSMFTRTVAISVFGTMLLCLLLVAPSKPWIGLGSVLLTAIVGVLAIFREHRVIADWRKEMALIINSYEDRSYNEYEQGIQRVEGKNEY